MSGKHLLLAAAVICDTARPLAPPVSTMPQRSTRRHPEAPADRKPDPEPRRSVRSTKGVHSKALDEDGQALPKPRAPTKKAGKKAQKKEPEPEEEDEEEEIIRCVCGASSDEDEDSGEAWIGCESCMAWQHNVCMGVSSFEDEIPENYYCEQCKPENHKELLEGMARGEKPWEERRRIHNEEKERKRKKKGGRKPKGGDRKSGSIDVVEKKEETKPVPAKPTPTPEPPKEKKEPAKGKRKTREESHDTEAKAAKVRRVSTEPAAAAQQQPAQPAQTAPPAAEQAVPSQPSQPAEPAQQPQEAQPPAVKPQPKPQYTPPKDLETIIKDLPPTRNGPAKLLKKSLVHVMANLAKNNELEVPEGQTVDSMAETSALQIERAVFDTHPMAKGQKEYSQQIKSLTFNIKSNAELVRGLIEGVHTPPTLAVMTSDQLASSELQKQTAEMRAKAEKASILYQADQSGPRVRRTHKGEEVVEDEGMTGKIEDAPQPPAGSGRRSISAAQDQGKLDKDGSEQADHPMRSPSQDEGPHRSPSQSNFDISKVFSKVRSPSTSQPRPRKPSMQVQTNTQVEDADVDRLLQEENDSPPYSPTEETQDPDVVWRGNFQMSTLADFKAQAKHIGGANFANSIGPWSDLIPKTLPVAGRIPVQTATEYLCSLRYSNTTDVIVVSIEPQREEDRAQIETVIKYFIDKERYGVVGLKAPGNVRDTYLVPVPAGEGGHPEFMLNLMDNHIPQTREHPMLLCVFVYRNDPSKVNASGSPVTPSQAQGSPTMGAPAAFAQRSNSMAAPAFSPATPAANGPLQSTTPVPIPQVPHGRGPAAHPPQQPQQPPPQQPAPPGHQAPISDAEKQRLNEEGRHMAHQVLGPELMSAATVQFLLPQAWQMTRREWEVIKNIYVKEPRAKDDLPFLGQLLEKKGKESSEAEQKEKAAAAGGAGA